MCFANKDRLFIRMSRGKSRIQAEICGDCGASDPAWACINRGILLCFDCCSVHRSLGRHISVVKSLRQGTWCPSVLNFVNSLNAHGANSVWEHCLLDSTGKATGRRKPTPKDSVHPTKSDFIKAKHVDLAFVLKPNLQDDENFNGNLETELSKQLHASVRTSNLETSLRLLVQGADPNFFHEEKKSNPIHVAAKFGQASQIELLIIYGADLNALDGNGNTPYTVAKTNNHNTIAERLIEAMYDVTDRITMFLGGKKPDHANGKHIIIPDTNNSEISEQLKIARGRLQLVPNKMFEELVMDLYDEVDRRECEAIWATTALNPDNVAVPFLPANPFLSATRNQGRQKLARFTPLEFAGLLTDVLIDARRRQNMANLRPLDSLNQQQSVLGDDPNLSDDEPIYDPVASDEDYAPVASIVQQNQHLSINDSHLADISEMEILRKKLNEYESEINQLKTKVEKLSSENFELKSKFSATNSNIFDEPLRIDLNGTENEPVLDGSSSSNQSTGKRPASMYERRLGSIGKQPDCRTTTSMYQMAGEKPVSEEITHRTGLVTRRLKELLAALSNTLAKDAFVPCAERIRIAVDELTAIFRNSNVNETTRESLNQLSLYNMRLQGKCERLQNAIDAEDVVVIDLYLKEVRECAFYIASAVKALYVQFE